MTCTAVQRRLLGSRRPTRSPLPPFSPSSVALPIYLGVGQYVMSTRDMSPLTPLLGSCFLPRILHGRICRLWNRLVHGHDDHRPGYTLLTTELTNRLTSFPALQGVGAGGIQASSLIIVADLTPLRQRGLFTSINNLLVDDSLQRPCLTEPIECKPSPQFLRRH